MPLFSIQNRLLQKRCQAFTLLELLTVIAIIGVLASIIAVAIGTARESARASRCSGNLRQIAQSLLLFASENRGNLPPGYVWDRSIAPYLGITLSTPETATPPAAVFTCPDDSRTLTSPRSYVVSAQSKTQPGVGVFSRSATAQSLKLSVITNASWTVLATEFYTGGWASSSQFHTSYAYVDGWQGVKAAPVSDDGSAYHGSGQNYAFCDGHVERLTPDQVVTSLGSSNGGRWRAYQP